jgi:hypothetical protein
MRRRTSGLFVEGSATVLGPLGVQSYVVSAGCAEGEGGGGEWVGWHWGCESDAGGVGEGYCHAEELSSNVSYPLSFLAMSRPSSSLSFAPCDANGAAGGVTEEQDLRLR